MEGAVYRRPNSNFELFLSEYERMIRYFQGKKSFILGDFNLDLLRYENSRPVKNFANLNFQYSFYSAINKLTRVSSYRATVIDHCWCNFVGEG